MLRKESWVAGFLFLCGGFGVKRCGGVWWLSGCGRGLAGLFRCARIRISKYACGVCWEPDVTVINEPSMARLITCSAIRGRTSLWIGDRHTKIF